MELFIKFCITFLSLTLVKMHIYSDDPIKWLRIVGLVFIGVFIWLG